MTKLLGQLLSFQGFELALAMCLDRGAFGASLLCRLLTSKDPKIAAMMWSKWVEWRYGKPKEKLEHSGNDGGPVQIQIISHIPRQAIEMRKVARNEPQVPRRPPQRSEASEFFRI